MKISKLKALWSLVTGGWSGLIVYILEAINNALNKLDPEKISKVSEVVTHIGNALVALVPLLPSKYQNAADMTIAAISKLAEALKDGAVSEQELNDEIDAVKKAIQAWKEIDK